MDSRRLQSGVADFEDILRARISSHMASGLVVRAVRQIYATRSAYEVLSRVAMLLPEATDVARKSANSGDQSSVHRPLPCPDAVRSAAPHLFEAVASGDAILVVSALAEMGVLALCPPLNQMLGRLEFYVGSVIGRARLIPLIELAIFTTELEEPERASKYLAEAQTLYPGASELHDIYTVEGVIALGAGSIGRAKQHLAESISICLEDDLARITCAVRVPNFMLADRLMQRGEREPVVKFLRGCRRVWAYCANHVDAWIQSIGIGQQPEFLSAPIFAAMNRPARKFRTLVIKASLLGHTLQKPAAGLPDNRMAFGEMKAELRRIQRAAIVGKLEMGRN